MLGIFQYVTVELGKYLGKNEEEEESFSPGLCYPSLYESFPDGLQLLANTLPHLEMAQIE